jgi:hypothetical protein
MVDDETLFALGDKHGSVLRRRTSQGGVIIYRGMFQHVRGRKHLRPGIDDPDSAACHAYRRNRAAWNVVRGFGGKVHNFAEAVSHIRRSKKRQLNGRAWTDAPYPQGLSEVCIMPWPVPIGCHIEKPQASDSRIQAKALRGVPGPMNVPLQDVIHRDTGLGEIVDEVMDAPSDTVRDVILIAAGDRLQGVMIQELIAGKNRPVGRLCRIVDPPVLGAGFGICGGVGTGNEREQGHYEKARSDDPVRAKPSRQVRVTQRESRVMESAESSVDILRRAAFGHAALDKAHKKPPVPEQRRGDDKPAGIHMAGRTNSGQGVRRGIWHTVLLF